MEGKVEIPPELWARLTAVAEARGFNSPQQLVLQLIELELAKDQSSSDAEVARKMEELGYLDFGRDI